MQSLGGRASILLTLFLAGVLGVKMLDAPRPAAVTPAPEEAAAKADAPEPKAAPTPQSVVMLAPPAPAQTPAPAPALKPTAPQPAIKPLQAAKPAAKVAHKIEPASLEPLRPTPSVEAPRIEAAKVSPLPQVREMPATVVPPAPAAARPQRVKHPGAKAAATGRVLLRVLEHGEGPGIEIAWPDSAGERAALADHMRRCYGMRLALMDPSGALYIDKSRRGAAWMPNFDFYSGFVRRTSGRLPGAERRLASDIRRRHGPVGATVHIFPRRVDALLLGGLQSLIGARYRSTSAIRAHYRLSRGTLTIGRLSVDGERVAGDINLSAAEHCRRGST